MPKPRCPVCRNRDGTEADGTVARYYRPEMKDGKATDKLKPLEPGVLRCKWCNTVLLTWDGRQWVSAHRVK